MESSEIKEKKIKIARTKKGIPCLWESLVNFSDLKRATVIYGSNKEPKTAVFFNQNREKQALVPITEGDYISKAFKDSHGIALSIFKIEEISSMENVAYVIPVFTKSSLVNESVNDSEYKNMINETINKLTSKKIISYIKDERGN